MEHIGKYKIIKELGAGGFGAVYLGEDPNLGTQVAIKVFRVKDENLAGLATSASHDAGSILEERFLSEARTLVGLSHNPFIVNLMEFDKLDDGTPYYVMPYLPTSLEHEIGKDAFTRGKLEEIPKELHPRKLASTKALDILKQVLEGMRDVHQSGLIHRDIKPANILFDAQGNVQICDFGIAKLPDAEHSQSGVGMGSRNYMSPEQRESAKHVSAASDVYSIGVLAYRMLTGQLPSFPFEPVTAFSPSVGQPISDLIEIAIAQQESKRPRDAGEFLKRFNAALSGVNEAAVDDDGTGTWVGGGADIKPELKPLKHKIEQMLREEGQINDKHTFSLQAMASVAGLSQTELEQFISGIEQELLSEITPFRNWLTFVDTQAKTHQGELDSEMTQVLLEAGQALGKDDDTLKGHIKAVCGRYQSAKKSVNPGQDVSEKTSRSASNDNSDKAHSSQKKTQHASSSTKKSKAKTVDGMTTAGKKPDSVKMLTGVGLAVALGVGTWLYTDSESAVQGNGASAVTATKSPKASAAPEDKTWQVKGVSFTLKSIPGGSFMMGSENGGSDEKPVHRVSIKPFRLMAHEVTWAMYQPCIDAGVCPDNSGSETYSGDAGWGKGNRPMINVSYNDITQKYIPWLNEQTGQTFRLPTEAEWEYAARAGSTSKYSWGNDIGNNKANCSSCGSQWDNSKTAPVKSFSPNAFGLYDMHGNVWEWVQDCHNGSYQGAPTNGSAWMQGHCESAVLRGGSWYDLPYYLRSAYRGWNDRTSRFYSFGLRLAQGE